MVIKVTGTTVINDSREIENIGDINRFIQKPEITNPVNSSTGNSLGLTIEGSPYAPIYESDERLYREFEIDIDSGDFSNPQRSTQINSDNFGPLDPTLDPNETYKVRIRDVSINGTVSEYSEVVTFATINITVDAPTITVEGEPSDVPEFPQITTSAFSVTNGSDTHESTDWEVIRTSDSTIVFSSFNDISNLTSITVTGGLDESQEYEFRARHRGATYGVSNYGSKTSTTIGAFISNTPLGDSLCGGFYMGTISAAGSCYYLIVAPNASGCAECEWKTTNSFTSGISDTFDGFGNTYNSLKNSTHPAGNWTATRSINGFSDWYLPAIEELRTFYDNGGGNGSGDPLPSGERFDTTDYLSSNQSDDLRTCEFNFNDGNDFSESFKSFSKGPLRAVRREPI